MEIHERIILAATQLFFRFGIRSVTMDELAKELGISKKTIYQHFPDKDALVIAVSKYRFTIEQCKSETLQQQFTNPIEEIIEVMKQLRSLLQHVHPALFFDLQKYYPKAWAMYSAHKDFVINHILSNMKAGIEAGLYRPDIDTEILARLRIESVELAFNNDIFPSDKFNLVDIQLAFMEHFLRGIMTPKGVALYEDLVTKRTMI